MRKLVSYIPLLIKTLILFTGAVSFAEDAFNPAVAIEYSPILSEKTTTCAKPTYCRINEPNDQIFLVWFDVSTETEAEETLREVKKINFKNSQTGAIQSFNLDDVARVAPNEPFRFYRLNLRKNGPTDLALFSFPSSKDGDLFIYFVFNPKTKKFVLTRDQVPLLRRTSNEKRFVGEENQNYIYDLDANLELKLNVSATQEATKKAESPSK